MDHKQFDELVARLSKAPNRRDALKGAVGSALAAIGLGVGVDDVTDAQAQGEGARTVARCIRECNQDNNNERAKVRCIRNCRRKRKCPPGFKRCGTQRCFNLNNDERHCGSCRNVCDGDQVCVRGECIVRS